MARLRTTLATTLVVLLQLAVVGRAASPDTSIATNATASVGTDLAPVPVATGTEPGITNHPILGTNDDAVLAEGVALPRPASAAQAAVIQAAAAALTANVPRTITVDYPMDESVFPPEIVPPTFLWHDPSAGCDTWLIDVAFAGGDVQVLSAGRAPRPGEIDPAACGPNNEIYRPTPYQASARSWTPAAAVWEAMKKRSHERPAKVTIAGFRSGAPDRIVSAQSVRFTTSADPVGAPIFYRDVPLMPAETAKGVIQPLAQGALPLIQWRLRDIGRDASRVVLRDMATCGNCHSFSADGKTLAMDIDGPTGDKGAYAIARIAPEMVIQEQDIITWNSFRDKPPGHRTIGFLSRISPDGKVAVSTVNEELYVRNFTSYQFLQVFYPTRGILAWYNTETKEMKALPGADDPQFVHCDPVWSPDGQWLVFARAPAQKAYPEGRPVATFANDPKEIPVQYDLYRIPFHGGQGGRPEPVRGAGRNDMSNTFPKVSPDGKWIVFVKSRNGQLMRPDSRLWIVPLAGGTAREMRCNTSRMNSWHSFSPNGRWLVFSSKANTPYTQMFLTHLDEQGNDSPPILIPNATAANRAVNIPEFVNIPYDGLRSIVTPTVEYYRDLIRGTDLLQQGRAAEAETALRQALQREPTSSRINGNLGVALRLQQRAAEAVPYLRRALETNPDMEEARFNLGSALLGLGQPQEAIREFQRADPESGLRGLVQAAWGAALMALGKEAEAAGHLRQALVADPRNDGAHANLGALLLLQGQNDQARQHLEAALQINPQNAVAHVNLGQLLAAINQDEAALPHFQAALQTSPGLVRAHQEMAVLYLKRGDHVLATQHLTRLVELEPHNPSNRYNLGALLAEDGQLAEAQVQLEQAVAAEPRFARAHYRLGTVLVAVGKTGDGIAHLRKAIELDPNYAPARQALESIPSSAPPEERPHD